MKKCKNKDCNSFNIITNRVTFKDGTKHKEQRCSACGKFQGYVKKDKLITPNKPTNPPEKNKQREI